jgi:hypothetical protein
MTMCSIAWYEAGAAVPPGNLRLEETPVQLETLDILTCED